MIFLNNKKFVFGFIVFGFFSSNFYLKPEISSEFLAKATIECNKIVQANSTMWNKIKNIKPKMQKHFVVIIPSYNNKDWYKKNLDSVFMQKYDNYTVIYIDDCSPDGTGDLVERYIKEKKQDHRVLLIKNKVRCQCMANVFKAVNMCKDSDIIVSLDGDDWYSTDHVLSMLNIIYQESNVMITHGQFIRWPENELRNCRSFSSKTIKMRTFRKVKGSHGPSIAGLRSYYAGLFKKIKIEDLMFGGDFLPVAHDSAIMYPMFEMAGERIMYIPDLLYIANRATPLNITKTNKDLRAHISVIIRSKPSYQVFKEKVVWQNLSF